MQGDTSNYSAYQKEPNFTNYGIIVIKNYFWPGQITVYSNKQWQSLYVGYGFKYSDQLYFPSYPEFIQEELSNMVEQNDPNYPKDLPKADNPDGDDKDKQKDD